MERKHDMNSDSQTTPDRLPEGFLDLPTLVYRNDPYWIPEDPDDVRRAFSDSNPWFKQGQAKCLCIPNKVRLATFLDPQNQVDAKQIAYFGYFESVGDQQANTQIFDQAKSWAKEKGAVELYGPINFTTFGAYRLLISDDPKQPPFPGEPYNPPTYPDMLTELGFEVAEKYLSIIGERSAIEDRLRMAEFFIKHLEDNGYRFETLTHQLWLDQLPTFYTLVDDIFKDNFGYTQLSRESFLSFCGEKYIRKACPHTSTITYAPDGNIAGFLLVYPHYGPIVVQGAKDNRIEVSKLDYQKHFPLLEKMNQRTAMIKTVGVLPDYRRQRLQDAMGARAVLTGDDRYDRWYAASIRQDNPSRNVGESIAKKDRRWYALYKTSLT
jgi:hypothetical protein